jgi:hypothetical protein
MTLNENDFYIKYVAFDGGIQLLILIFFI